MHSNNTENKTKDDSKRRDLFVFVRQTMCIAAMYPLGYYVKGSGFLAYVVRFLGVFYELFNYFVSVHIAGLYICTIYINYGQGDLDFFVNCLIQTIIYLWTIAMKLYFRRLRPGLLDDILASINDKYEPRSAVGFSYVSMAEAYRISKLWIKTYVYCCYIGTIFWLALPIVYRDKSLPLACWYPFDYTVRFTCFQYFQTNKSKSLSNPSCMRLCSSCRQWGRFRWRLRLPPRVVSTWFCAS